MKTSYKVNNFNKFIYYKYFAKTMLNIFFCFKYIISKEVLDFGVTDIERVLNSN